MESFLGGNVLLGSGDCIEILRSMDENSVDSVVTDPPYHLASIVQRFGAENAVPAKKGKTGAYARASAGFMGKKWDGGDIAFRVELWAEVLRILKPGGHVVAFGASRGYHRMACAIEDAGFEIRDSLMWVYGTGFPKSHDVSKGIDKTNGETGRALKFTTWMRSTGLKSSEIDRITGTNMGGHYTTLASQPAVPTRALFEMLRPHITVEIPEWIETLINRVEAEREVVGTGTKPKPTFHTADIGGDAQSNVYDLTAPATPAAREWEGWGTAMKPAHEPITVATKPLTIQQHFAILLDYLTDLLEEQTIWSGLNVHVAETSFSAIRAKLDAVTKNIVLDSARMRALARFDPARFAEQNSTFRDQGFCVATKTKDDSVPSSARQPSNAASYLALITPHGPADDLSTRIAAMCMSVITAGISENTVSSWVEVSDAILSRANTFTIETASRLTIALRTWNSLTSPNTIDGTGSLSPNVAPIVLARKPLSEGTVAANVLRWRTGALNIGACRVGVDPVADASQLRTMSRGQRTDDTSGQTWGMSKGSGDVPQVVRPEGRWPANVVHDGSDEVIGAFSDSNGQQGLVKGTEPSSPFANVYGDMPNQAGSAVPRGDSGSAARFFFSAKADTDDRIGSKHPTVKPVDLNQWLCRLVTPPGGTVLDLFAGTGSTGEAAWREGFNCILIEREEEYQADIRRRMALCLAGPEEKSRAIIKEKLKGKPIDAGPLFSTLAVESKE